MNTATQPDTGSDINKRPDVPPQPAPGPVDKDDTIMKTPEDAVKEPLIPVPAIDEINPPLQATLGGDDLVIPLEKEQ